MKTIVVILALGFTGSGFAAETDCLSTHLSEAMAINSNRKPLYSKLSQGKSEKISNALIWSERILNWSSWIVDLPALYWQENGVPVGCLDFVPMDLTPDYQDKGHATRIIPKSYSVWKIQKDLIKEIWNDDQKAVITFNNIIDDLASEPRYHCFKRHLLESARRSISLLPFYELKSQESELISPRYFVLYLSYMQIFGLFFADYVDELAYPIQKEGIAILCQDVPHIPIFQDSISH